MAKTIHLEEKKGIAVVYLNRPEAYNAFDLAMVQRLAETLSTWPSTRTLPVWSSRGKGKAFCAGGDLQWVNTHDDNLPKAFHQLAARFHQAILEIRRMPKPVVAAINGLAAGGGFSMALSCDFRVMATSAILKQGYTSNGLSIDGGGTFILPRLVGAGKGP
jgi:2-(1,2-epoxy-1,2-dihydrophenyl)acetyl-CoA isomerase